MIVKYRSHTFQVAECDLILMGDSFYAKVDLGQRGLSYPHYIKIEQDAAKTEMPTFYSGLDYCYPEEPPIVYTVPERIYPQAVWLGLANYLLAMAKRQVDVRVAVAESELVAA